MYAHNRTMITRTFLFLLAMVTGFSTANAAQTQRVAPSEIGVAASVVLVHAIAAQSAERAASTASYSQTQPFKLPAMAKFLAFAVQEQTATITRTYRSDRSRE
jgi:hypothetical protein